MSNQRNLYRILHIQHDAPQEIVRASYRALMQTLKAHPDLGGCPLNARDINHAYDVLSDPNKRSAYNQMLARKQHPVMQVSQRLSQPTAAKTWQPFVPPSF